MIREVDHIYLNWLDHLDKSNPNAIEEDYIATKGQVSKVVFSPLGTYMAVCCSNGIYIYVGKALKLKCFFKQSSPVDVKFSPNEKYMVSSDGSNMKYR